MASPRSQEVLLPQSLFNLEFYYRSGVLKPDTLCLIRVAHVPCNSTASQLHTKYRYISSLPFSYPSFISRQGCLGASGTSAAHSIFTSWLINIPRFANVSIYGVRRDIYKSHQEIYRLPNSSSRLWVCMCFRLPIQVFRRVLVSVCFIRACRNKMCAAAMKFMEYLL